jgi:hypothetical protein
VFRCRRFVRLRVFAVVLVAAVLSVAGTSCSSGAEGRVLDVDGHPQAGCVVGAVQLFDEAGQRRVEVTPSLTRTDADGRWNLSGLEPGTHLLFTWQPGHGANMPGTDELVAMARAFATGVVPASGRYARGLSAVERHTSEVGVALELGLFPGEGVHLTGRLTGERLAGRLEYIVTASVKRGEIAAGTAGGFSYDGPGRLMRTSTFLGTVDAEGRFDLGWVLPGDPVNVSVRAVPSKCVQLASAVLSLSGEAVEAEIALPRHEIRQVHVTGPDDRTQEPRRLNVRFWEPGRSRGNVPLDPGERLDVVVPAGGMLLQATTDGYASRHVAVEPTGDSIGGDSAGDIRLELLPVTGTTITLVDEAGQSIEGAWIFVGTEATAGFTDPLPLFSVTDEAGMLMNMSLPLGNYPAQLVHDKGTYDEWRVDFDIDVTSSRNTVTVPLSTRHSPHR